MNTRSGATYDGAELIEIVHDLVQFEHFNPDEFVIAGSARLWLEGCITELSDLDLVAIGSTWDRAWDLAVEGIASFGEGSLNLGKTVTLFQSRIEISNAWISPHGDPYRLIENATCIDGLRYPSLKTVIEYKTASGRLKDEFDLARLRACRPGSSKDPVEPPQKIHEHHEAATAVSGGAATTLDPMPERKGQRNSNCGIRRVAASPDGRPQWPLPLAAITAPIYAASAGCRR